MIKKVTIESIKPGDKKSGETKGKKWVLLPVGLKIMGNWYNGTVFNTDIELVDTWENGNILYLDFYKEEYDGKTYNKWRIPKTLDLVNYKLDEILTKLDNQ